LQGSFIAIIIVCGSALLFCVFVGQGVWWSKRRARSLSSQLEIAQEDLQIISLPAVGVELECCCLLMPLALPIP